MGIKTISGSPAIPAPITAGKIPYADGTNTLTYLPIGSVGQVLKVNTAVNAPEWANPAVGVKLASYSGTADVVLANIPQYLSTIEILLWTAGAPSNVSLTGFTYTLSATCTGHSSTTIGYNAAAATGTTAQALASSTGTAMVFPRSNTLGVDGGSLNFLRIVLPDFSGFSGFSYGERIIQATTISPPSGGVQWAHQLYTLSPATAGITGFTISLGGTNSQILVLGY